MRLIDHSTPTLTLLQAHLGGDRNWQYILADPTGEACLVDPGHDPDGLLALLAERDLRPAAILVTHGHADHIGALEAVATRTGAAVHAGDATVFPGARAVADGEVIAVGKLRVEALLTPGHAPDHVCYRCEDALISGDLLFCGKVGGTGPYFTGSSAAQEWDSLQRLLQLPDAVRVFPGHDYFGGEGEMTASTIGHERQHNPFLQCADLAAFEDLKANWAAYKQEHGIR